MPFKRFVEIGRVALVNYGKDYRKLAVIVNASLNDFDRFKLMLANIKRDGVVRQELANLKKEVQLKNLSM
ncbi:60S ribosomal protein L14-1 [Capsicum annuum]|nr:60S ribosomal protein L14-1 [Capsicum annuum]